MALYLFFNSGYYIFRQCIRLDEPAMPLVSWLASMLILAVAPVAAATGPVAGAGLGHAFLGGLIQPLLGLDHLAFLVGLGLAALAQRRRPLLPLAFIAASLAGLALRTGGGDIPYAGTLVAFTVLGLGVVLIAGLRLPLVLWLAGAALAGLLHGYMHGGAARAAPLGSILVFAFGVALTQWGVMAAAMTLAGRFGQSADRALLTRRLAGGLVAGIGLVLVASAVAEIVAEA
jgi:urease accessory protein